MLVSLWGRGGPRSAGRLRVEHVHHLEGSGEKVSKEEPIAPASLKTLGFKEIYRVASIMVGRAGS